MIRFLQTEGPFKKIVLSGLLLLICAAMVIAFVPGIGSDTSGAPGAGIVAKVDGEDITCRGSAGDGAPNAAAARSCNWARMLPCCCHSLPSARPTNWWIGRPW